MATPNLDGFWYVEGENNITEIKGGEGYRRQLWEFDLKPIREGSKCTITFGEFGEITSQEIIEKTGAKHYNLESRIDFFAGQMASIYGVASEDGQTMYYKSVMVEARHAEDKMTTVNKLSPQKKKEILENRTHEDELIPPGFTPQPNVQGKIIFICGPPGAGKSTTAQYLAKEKGWVYYEADCFTQCVDPFIALDAKEPSNESISQKPIKGRSSEVLECMKSINEEFFKMSKKLPYDLEKIKSFYRVLAKDVVKHKTRLGGTFVAAHACPMRELRDCMKEIFGSECIFVTLSLSKEVQAKRVEARHADGHQEMMKGLIDFLASIYDLYEDVQPGEDNCITVQVDPDDSREDVMNKILDQVH